LVFGSFGHLPFNQRGHRLFKCAKEILRYPGRAILENKRCFIPENQPPILERLQIDAKHWLYMTQNFESRFKGLVGMSYSLKAVCRKLGYRRTPNLGAVQSLLT
ncbi:MAG: hypothetical protein ABW104_07125, partial [Candidatus Thiodiazotropha sp. 6PLUC2]